MTTTDEFDMTLSPPDSEPLSRSRRRDAFLQFRQDPVAVVGVVIIVLFVFTGVFGPYLTPYDPLAQSLDTISQGPSWEHWLGTDGLGRDMLSRVMAGSRTGLLVATLVTSVSAIVGVLLGAIAGLYGGWRDGLIGSLIDVVLAFPWLLVAAFLNASLKPVISRWADALGWGFVASSSAIDYVVVVGALGLLFWGGIARVVRGQLLSLREKEFVLAAEADGASNWHLIRKHLVPNALGPVVVIITVSFGGALLLEAALSFLGIGIQPPAASLGAMINDNLAEWRYHPHLVFVPVIVVAVVLSAFTLVGDRLDDVLDPRRNDAGGPASSGQRSGSDQSVKVLADDDQMTDAGADAVLTTGPESALLDVRDLSVKFQTRDGSVSAVKNFSMTVGEGEVVALVGESGSGKTVTALSMLGLLSGVKNARVSGGIRFDGQNLLDLTEREMRTIRGKSIGMVAQASMSSLSPLRTIGWQLVETLRTHERLSRSEARARAVELLDLVGIPSAASRLKQYPHQLSGGMQQRVVIALALSCNPRLLIADEPTTALDVTIQAEILEILRRLTAERRMSLILVTHDLGVAAQLADRINVMYAGQIVETGTASEIFDAPTHPYTIGLLRSVADVEAPRRRRLEFIPGSPPNPLDLPVGCRFRARCSVAIERCATEMPPLVALAAPSQRVACWVASDRNGPAVQALSETHHPSSPGLGTSEHSDLEILRTSDLKVHFKVGSRLGGERRVIRSVDGVSLSINRGETVGLVGESGSGKSTLGRSILHLIKPTSGEIYFEGEDLADVKSKQLQLLRRRMKIIFQDPYSALDPRMNVASLIAEPIEIIGLASREDVHKRVGDLMEMVRLDARMARRYPHELSGGQRQRVCIARALAVNPEFIVCDEPVSALDVSIQAQIISLLQDLKEDLNLTYLFISHDLNVVRQISDRVAVMYAGRLVEVAPTDDLFEHPRHPYTQALLSAIPKPVRENGVSRTRIILSGEIPDPGAFPVGCRFNPRCAHAQQECTETEPDLESAAPDHIVSCHFWQDLSVPVSVVGRN